MSTIPNGNALQPPTYNGARVREIDDFIWGLEADFGAVGIEDETQKISNASFSLRDIALVWWRRRCDNVKRGSDPITTWDGFKGELKSSSIPSPSTRLGPSFDTSNTKMGEFRSMLRNFKNYTWRFRAWGSETPYFAYSMAYVVGPRWSLRGVVCKTLPL